VEPSGKDTNWFREFQSGILHIQNIRWLLVGTILFTTIMFVLQLVDSQFVTLLRLLPLAPVHVLGLALSASGLGVIVSSVMSSRIKWTSLIPAMSFGALGVGVAFGGMALVILFLVPGTALFFLPCGLSSRFVIIPFQSSAQEGTPVHLTGRVFGVINSLSNGAALLSGSLLVLIWAIMLFLKKVSEPRGIHVAKGNTGIQGTPSQ